MTMQQTQAGGAAMGHVIDKDAATGDIVTDATKTRTNATARGGRWQELAESRLSAPCALFANFDAQHKAAVLLHAPNAAKVVTLHKQADNKIGNAYDTIWNEVGRPGTDAALSVIFAEGIASYTEGDTPEQPDRMRILVTLLGAGIHPKLSAATANAFSVEITSEADALEAAVNAARQTGAKVKVFSRVRTALGKVVQAELVNLKRLYKAEGFTEAEIHAVIPDRPGKTKKATRKGAPPDPGTPTPEPTP
jgi:hypothetical protein